MFDYFFIPTVGRANNQITYKSLSPAWQDRTILVVQDHEKDLYPDYKTMVLPKRIKTIAPTREYIIKFACARKYRFGVLDDDLNFVRLRMAWEPQVGLTKKKMVSEDFLDLEMLLLSWMDQDGIMYCGLDSAANWPLRDIVYREWCRVTSNHFFDGRVFPADEFEYTTFQTIEDYYLIMQMITKGIKPRISSQFRFAAKQIQSPGGCANYRTLEMHNADWRGLQAKYPQYIKLTEDVPTEGPWAGQVKLGGLISWKKFVAAQPHSGQTIFDIAETLNA